MARSIRPPEERFWLKVRISEDGCWLWIGAKNNRGYGVFGRGRKEDGLCLAHRWSYEHMRGPIPEGLVLDHLCRNVACVNPAHLEAVTGQTNILRGQNVNVLIHHADTCARGHPRTLENVYWRPDRPGRWNCRECKRENDRARYQNRKGTA